MSEFMQYEKNIYPGTREELVAAIKEQLKEKRFNHVLRVEQTAVELAEENGVDLEKASIAGLVHDYAKQRSDAEFVSMIKKHELDPDLLNWGNAIWHGVVGAEFVRDELQIFDEDILNAVRHHTTGAVSMSPLEQVVYMADYIEPKRDFPEVDEARKVTHNSLTDGVIFQTKHTLAYLVAKDAPVYPATVLTYNRWVAKKRAKYNY